MASATTSPVMDYSVTPSWSRSNTPLLSVIESVDVLSVDDGFQLGVAALDVAAIQPAPDSLAWSGTSAGASELVTRHTFLELPTDQSNHFVDEMGRRKRAVSEDTGFELMQAEMIGHACLPAGDGDSLASGVADASTSSGGGGPSECSASESSAARWADEPVIKEDPTICFPDVATPMEHQHYWVPAGQSGAHHSHHPPWVHAGQGGAPIDQYWQQANWIRGPSGPNGFFQTSEDDRIRNRALWS